MTDRITTDVLVVGSGIAGCTAALSAARAGADVHLVTKATQPSDAATDWAQGGIATTRADPEQFAEDIITASDGTADPEAVSVLVENAPQAIEELLVDTLGVSFDTDGEGYAYGQEGGHSIRRILHVGATTGEHILRPFLQYLQDNAAITIHEDTAALELITHEGRVHGALIDTVAGGQPVFAGSTILATGGIGSLYSRSTNPPGATGDGIGMAALAGAETADMAFVQFHPTAYAADDPDALFLLSEAVRGEGATLINAEGERFMPTYHPDAELAPRDVVARAIAEQRAETGEVYLDVSSLAFESTFPELAAKCTARDIDYTTGIPVAPCQHFLCGGIAVDTYGRTSLDQLYAVGECSRTGVHGANRLASTGLLEGLVWGRRAGQDAAGTPPTVVEPPELSTQDPTLPDQFATEKLTRLQTVMDDHVGLYRTPEGLRTAQQQLRRIKGEIDAYTRTRTSRSLYELRNAIVTGLLIARDAASREKSVGCHALQTPPAVPTE